MSAIHKANSGPGARRMSRGTAALLSLALLAGVATQRLLGPSPVDAAPYLQRIRQIKATTPLQFGTWVGEEQTVPTAAVAMLRPNVLLSRGFSDLETGRKAAFLFVDCSDARDLAGHYPPICYPNTGWTQTGSEKRDWHVLDWTVHGTEYEFTTQPFRGRQTLIVMNTMVMPDGQFYADIDSIRRAAARLTRRYWGAGQIQVVVDASMTQQARDEVFNAILIGHASLIAAVLNTNTTNRPGSAIAARGGQSEIFK